MLILLQTYLLINILIYQLMLPEKMNTFMYFAYGSNMLAQRIHIKNPSAIRIRTGKLNGFRLDFNTYSKTWNGCPSTVVPDPENHVWGVLWQLDMKDLDNLDQQEGVPKKRYLPFEANITTPDGEIVLCRSYMLVNQPIKQIPLPQERRPSKTYLETIVLGANESNLPFEYIKFLNEIPNNGKEGPKMPWSKIQS